MTTETTAYSHESGDLIDCTGCGIPTWIDSAGTGLCYVCGLEEKGMGQATKMPPAPTIWYDDRPGGRTERWSRGWVLTHDDKGAEVDEILSVTKRNAHREAAKEAALFLGIRSQAIKVLR